MSVFGTTKPANASPSDMEVFSIYVPTRDFIGSPTIVKLNAIDITPCCCCIYNSNAIDINPYHDRSYGGGRRGADVAVSPVAVSTYINCIMYI